MKRILVAEDEDVIRDFVVINLRRNGYEVVDVPNGDEAIRVFDENNGDFDICLLDIMMPGRMDLLSARRSANAPPLSASLCCLQKARKWIKLAH